MEEILIQNAQTFASQHQLQLAERLGFGIHGIIFVAEDKSKAGKTALKVHRAEHSYGGCIALQHRVPRLSGWLIPGRGLTDE